ncbi:hypothetical protein E2C01_039748 [Portunus trituberculatus]|uniref:Uncharacterized protein n=1 Tax=Portunus trituberculatus TaxID=210409 RepID=A0A5B7FLJ7_PORTR|nr:hypothetical protein [Portunus trituberculatus]
MVLCGGSVTGWGVGVKGFKNYGSVCFLKTNAMKVRRRGADEGGGGGCHSSHQGKHFNGLLSKLKAN